MIRMTVNYFLETTSRRFVISDLHSMVLDEIDFEIHHIYLFCDVFWIDTRCPDNVARHIHISDAKIFFIDPTILPANSMQFTAAQRGCKVEQTPIKAEAFDHCQ